MAGTLVGWARAVKARRGGTGAPILWLLTDADRLPDPRPVVARLPKGLAGVVLRHDGVPGRAALARDLAAICRARRLRLAVAGDWRLAAALGVGLHLRGGRRPGTAPRWLRVWTSSAHSVADLRRARQAGAALALLSPVFATRSHPGARGLGPLRWGLMARRTGGAGALGGVNKATVRRLPGRWCAGVGAIEGLS